jgi:hypothetical protein
MIEAVYNILYTAFFYMDKPENILLDKSFASIWNNDTVYKRGGGKSAPVLHRLDYNHFAEPL